MSVETTGPPARPATSDPAAGPGGALSKCDRDRIYRRFHNGSNVRLPAPLAEQWSWQLKARCRGFVVDAFYPPQEKTNEGRRERERRERDAVAVCRGCTVIEQCRDYALAVREPYGVWGGLTEDERMDILYYDAAIPEPARTATHR